MIPPEKRLQTFFEKEVRVFQPNVFIYEVSTFLSGIPSGFKKNYDKVLKINEEFCFDKVSIKHVKNKSSSEEKFIYKCRKRVRNLNTRKYLSNAMELAKSLLAATTNEFDRHPLLINIINGTFDLDLHEFREHEHKDLILKQCPNNFDEMTDCLSGKHFSLEFSKQIKIWSNSSNSLLVTVSQV